MTVLTIHDEQNIEQLVKYGNDEQATRLVYTLLELGEQQVQERESILRQLGERYLVLALLHEDGLQADQTVEALLERRCRAVLQSCTSAPHLPDERAISWYEEAVSNLKAAASLHSIASHGSLVTCLLFATIYTLLYDDDQAREQYNKACIRASTSEEQAELAYVRSIISAHQQDRERAIQALSDALSLAPQVQKYLVASSILRACS